MEDKIKTAFDLDVLSVRLSDLLETCPRSKFKNLASYQSILASIREVGILQPISVYPAKQSGKYKIIEGHLRYYAMQELNAKKIDCIIAHEDERYTQEAKVNYINPIQRAKMFAKTIKGGVPLERIVSALNLDKGRILSEIKAVEGIDDRTREILKAAPISAAVLRALAKVKPLRQIEIAEFMINSNNYGIHFASGLVMSSPDSMLYEEKPKKFKNYVPADVLTSISNEQANMQVKIRETQTTYNKNVCELTTLVSFVKKILDNGILSSYLKRNFEDIFYEFTQIAKNEITNDAEQFGSPIIK